jgi:hypothetical protein
MKNPLLYWSARPESGREGREVFKIAPLARTQSEAGAVGLRWQAVFGSSANGKASHPEIRDSMSRSRRVHLLQNRSHLVPFSSRPGAAYEIQK